MPAKIGIVPLTALCMPHAMTRVIVTVVLTTTLLVWGTQPGLARTDHVVSSLLEQRHRHVILQQFDLSCGAAALATILRYQHGESLDERRVALGLISRDVYVANPGILRIRQGFSLLDMKRYVEQLGYDGIALGELTFDDLLDLAPAIVPVRMHGYNHFVVFRGRLGNSVALADPAFGNRTLTLERFIAAWTDYAQLGHVAFAVQRRDALIPPNRLGVTSTDFPILGRRP
jgi:uncharacterized protein